MGNDRCRERLAGLRVKLAAVVSESGSLTDPGVLAVSHQLDEAVLQCVRCNEERQAAQG